MTAMNNPFIFFYKRYFYFNTVDYIAIKGLYGAIIFNE